MKSTNVHDDRSGITIVKELQRFDGNFDQASWLLSPSRACFSAASLAAFSRIFFSVR